jgi:hypothetical protein
MALLGHHFFSMSAPHWATRLQGLLPHRVHPSVSGFKVSRTSPSDPEACAAASALYAGQTALTAEDFLSLRWLDCFARSNRQLLLCHALKLLEGWTAQRKARLTPSQECECLEILCKAAPDFAFHLNPDLLQPLARAMQQQLRRVWASRVSSLADHIKKADVLAQASKVIQNGQTHALEAVRLWELSVPHLVAADGSPTTDSLDAFVKWISPLLAAQNLLFAPATRQALDRAAPFLSMLIGSDGRFCFSNETPVEILRQTPPLRHARNAAVAHLSAGKTTVIAMPQHLHAASQISISSQGHHLCDADFAPTAHMPLTTLDVHQTEQGHLLQQMTDALQRTVFLSPKGDDLRIEENCSGASALYFRINSEARISLARAGTQATLSLGAKNLWQLTLRGGKLSETSDPHILRVNLSAQRLHWALKSIARSTSKSSKPVLPELPF